MINLQQFGFPLTREFGTSTPCLSTHQHIPTEE